MQIKEASTEEDYIQCFEVMKELRPHHNAGSFIATIAQMKKEGFGMIPIHEAFLVDPRMSLISPQS